MRAVTFNIHHGAEGLAGVARQLQGLLPDIVFLQEVDRGCRRSGGVDQVQTLAAAVGLHAAFGEAFPLDGGHYGVALLSRWPLTDARTIVLPHPSPRRDDGAGEPRVLLIARADGRTFACTHLGLTDSERIEQATAIRKTLSNEPDLLLGGDLNEGPNAPVCKAWSGWLHDSFRVAGGIEERSGPPDRPPVRIDHILHAGRWTPHHAWLAPGGTSDHRAVVVDFEETP